MFCTECGNELPTDANFCVHCGHPAPPRNLSAEMPESSDHSVKSLENDSVSLVCKKFIEHFAKATEGLPESEELFLSFASSAIVPPDIYAKWQEAAPSLNDDQISHLWLALKEAKNLGPKDLPEPLIDLIAPLVEWHHPGKVQQLLGKTKLIYLQGIKKHNDLLLTSEVKSFLNVFLDYSRPLKTVSVWELTEDDKGRALACFFNDELVLLRADGRAEKAVG